MQKEGQNSLYRILKNVIPKNVLTKKNKAKTWEYGYNDKYDIVIISNDGTIGDIYEVNHLKIALPKSPNKSYTWDTKKENQYWRPFNYPKELKRIKSIFQWNEMPTSFKNEWVDYIEEEFDRREKGFWFYE